MSFCTILLFSGKEKRVSKKAEEEAEEKEEEEGRAVVAISRWC